MPEIVTVACVHAPVGKEDGASMRCSPLEPDVVIAKGAVPLLLAGSGTH